jgi:hypothetical protein
MVAILGLFVNGGGWAASRTNPVEVDGDRLSAHADGIPLGELLTAVGAMTGVQFAFDESMAEEKVFVDFEGVPLPQGIKKIINSFNRAEIYDDAGKLCKVVILGRWEGSGVRVTREGGKGAPEFRRPGTVPSASKEGSDIPAASKVPRLVKRTAGYHSPPLDRSNSGDGPKKSQDQGTEGPPLNRPYLVDGPPVDQGKAMEGPPKVEVPDNPPPADSGGSVMDGPPLDREYLIDGPPGWKN